MVACIKQAKGTVRKLWGKYLDVQDDFIAVVSWEELLHVGSDTGLTAERVYSSTWVYTQQDWHSGSVGLNRGGAVVVGVQPVNESA